MTPHRETGRCVCGCARNTHDHFRRGTDCGRCGRSVCRRFISLSLRDTADLSTCQRIALAESDAHVYRNLAALAQFTPSRRVPIPVPAQRTRREVFDAARARAAVAQARARGNKPKR